MPLNRIVWILLPLIAGLVHCQPKPHPEKMWRMYLQGIGVRFDAQFARDFYPGLREGILATRGRGQHPADQYTATCVAANSGTTINVMDLPPDQLPPGQSLDVATGDPGIKDRSISRMMLNWVPYMNDDFRHVCADDRLCDPTTYYREFRAVRAAARAIRRS